MSDHDQTDPVIPGVNRAIPRRHVLKGLLALPLVAAGVACGDDDDDDGETVTATEGSSESATPTEGATEAESPTEGTAEGETPPAASDAYPVTIEHQFGSTTIETPPERIVAAGFNEVDFLLAFGVVPVGVRDFIGTYPEATRPWAVDLIGDAELVDIGGQEIDFEVVAQLDPDLIMAVYAFLEDGPYNNLSGIAPTVAGPERGATWKEQTLITGRALGQESRAQELVDGVDERFTQAAADNPEFAGKTLAILWGVSEPGAGYYLLPDTDLRAQVFYDLGFDTPPTMGEISAEEAHLVDQDVIVVFGWTEEDLAGDALFQGLTAVQEGRVIYFAWESDLAGALGFASPLSLPYAIDLAVPQLATALEGTA